MDSGWIGFIGVILGSIITGAITFIVNHHNHKHELKKLELEKQEQRNELLRDKYELLTENVIQFYQFIQESSTDPLVAGKQFDDSYLKMISKFEVQTTLICTLYIDDVHDDVADFIKEGVQLMGSIRSYSLDSIGIKKQMTNELLVELEDYGQLYVEILNLLQEESTKYLNNH